MIWIDVVVVGPLPSLGIDKEVKSVDDLNIVMVLIIYQSKMTL